MHRKAPYSEGPVPLYNITHAITIIILLLPTFDLTYIHDVCVCVHVRFVGDFSACGDCDSVVS